MRDTARQFELDRYAGSTQAVRVRQALVATDSGPAVEGLPDSDQRILCAIGSPATRPAVGLLTAALAEQFPSLQKGRVAFVSAGFDCIGRGTHQLLAPSGRHARMAKVLAELGDTGRLKALLEEPGGTVDFALWDSLNPRERNLMRIASLIDAKSCAMRLIELGQYELLDKEGPALLALLSDKPLLINAAEPRVPPADIATLYVLLTPEGRARLVTYEEYVKGAKTAKASSDDAGPDEEDVLL